MTWTGCYVGGGGGYGLWDQENTAFIDATSSSPRTQATLTNSAGGRGYLGTVQAGCDYQFSQSFVIGVFGDYDFDSIKGTHETPFVRNSSSLSSSSSIGSATASEKMRSAWSVGGRVGWLVFPNFLSYFSAGYTEATFDRQDFFGNTPGGSALGFYLDRSTSKGYFLGAGDEYALSFIPGLFWKTEYRVSQFDTKTLPFLNTSTGLSLGTSDDSKKWVQTVRTELVYRFNWGKGPVARYGSLLNLSNSKGSGIVRGLFCIIDGPGSRGRSAISH
jgi:outer membrane immunogenic protein